MNASTSPSGAGPLDGRVALVTGGGAGIGLGLATAIARHGGSVVQSASNGCTPLGAAAQEGHLDVVNALVKLPTVLGTNCSGLERKSAAMAMVSSPGLRRNGKAI